MSDTRSALISQQRIHLVQSFSHMDAGPPSPETRPGGGARWVVQPGTAWGGNVGPPSCGLTSWEGPKGLDALWVGWQQKAGTFAVWTLAAESILFYFHSCIRGFYMAEKQSNRSSFSFSHRCETLYRKWISEWSPAWKHDCEASEV